MLSISQQRAAFVLCNAVLLLSVSAAAAEAGIISDYQAALSRHNQYRKRHQATALSWSVDLAKGAAAQAATCTFSVDSSNPHGVNIYATSSSEPGSALSAAVDFWYNQITHYNFSAPGYQQAADSFTQLVWAASTAVGCAAQPCTEGMQGIQWGGQAAEGTLVVCWYSPAGNEAGNSAAAFTQNVKPDSSEPALHTPSRLGPSAPLNHTKGAAGSTTGSSQHTAARSRSSTPAKSNTQLYPKVIHPASMNAVYQRLIQKISSTRGKPSKKTSRTSNATKAGASSSSSSSTSTAFKDAIDAPEIDLPASSNVASVPRQLKPQDTLLSPSCLQSSNKLYKLCLHDSGNLVLYQNQGNGRQAVWASNTAFRSAQKPFTLKFESRSPVLLVSDAKGDTVWRSRLPAGMLAAAKNSGYSYRAMLNSNGNFVVMDSDRRTVWSTRTGRAKQTKHNRA